MAQMPVATLRAWEQRHRAVQPATSAAGHRLYSAADVQRVLLLRQLSARGHAIGSLAPLGSAQLQRLALGQDAADTEATGRASLPPPAATPLRVVVVGPALALRLQRAAVTRRLRPPPRLVSVYGSLAEAAQAGPGQRADLLLWQAGELHGPPPPELLAAARACDARRLAVVYRHAGAQATRWLAATGAVPLREPADDHALGAWLATLAARPVGRSTSPRPPASPGAATDAPAPPAHSLAHSLAQSPPVSPPASPAAAAARSTTRSAKGRMAPSADLADLANQAEPADPTPTARPAVRPPGPTLAGGLPPRRFDDAALTAFASLSPDLACECPRHVAELLMQLSSFERYSAACAHRHPADAALHAHLQQVAGQARAAFEQALVRIAQHEGMPLD